LGCRFFEIDAMPRPTVNTSRSGLASAHGAVSNTDARVCSKRSAAAASSRAGLRLTPTTPTAVCASRAPAVRFAAARMMRA
jgi:hypothetical protein